ncbi:MAG TPA: cytochrome c1 [Noviherbaspirillum sp.]|nr:cytochrome c1 [Noviherbaspirillum sp.]
MKLMKKLIAALAFVPMLAIAAEATFPLDTAPRRTTDMAALQNGAKLFVNYCLNCHSASAMRYNLLFTSDKVGDLMTIAMSRRDAATWFGAAPPDLSVIARAKSSHDGPGADWLYTYLRTFYKDDTRELGWNNLVFPNVGMPHAMWELQGIREAVFEEVKDPHNPNATIEKFVGFRQVRPGTMTPLDFDHATADLVAYLEWMAEPAQNKRKQLGVIVLLFLFGFCVLTWLLNKTYWKDIK